MKKKLLMAFLLGITASLAGQKLIASALGFSMEKQVEIIKDLSIPNNQWGTSPNFQGPMLRASIQSGSVCKSSFKKGGFTYLNCNLMVPHEYVKPYVK